MQDPATALLNAHLDRLLVAGLLSLALGAALAFRMALLPFGLMTAIWGAIDSVISLASNPKPPNSASGLLPTVAFNEGLNVAYMAVGVTMLLLARERATVRGFGLAIVIQGAILLGLDGKLWFELTQIPAMRF